MRIAFWTSLATFLIDQASKYYVLHWLRLDERLAIDVWPPFLNLRMAWNTGVNFGLFASAGDAMRWVLIAVSLAISLWVILWMRGHREARAIVFVSAGLLVGGALGNVIDRLLYGAVADFLNMSCCGIRNPFAFNVADIAIVVGALGLVLFAGDKPKEKAP
jgi:signal peptidase II